MKPSLRRPLRSAVVLSLTALALAACGSGERNNPLGYDSGMAPAGADSGLGTAQALALFVLAPLLVVLTIALLVWLPGMVRGNRYRPARGWSAAPLWFGGPPDPAAAVETAQIGELTRGGASGSW